MNEKKNKKQESVLAGVAGAFLGSLLGAAVIILVGQLGYVASLSGLIMAVCTLKGYEMLGGTLSRKGAVIACLMTLVMTYVAHQAGLAVSIAREVGVNVFTAFQSIPYLLAGGYLNTGAYWGDLAMLYLFVLLGAVPTLLAALRGEHEAQGLSQPLPQGEGETEESIAVYFAPDEWTRTLRIIGALSMLLILPGVFLLLYFYGQNPRTDAVSLGFLALMSVVLPMTFLFWNLALMLPADAFRWAYARSGRRLYRVELVKLNGCVSYGFTRSKIQLTGIRWSKLSPEEQQQAERSIRKAVWAISYGESEMERSILRRAVLEVANPQLVKENKWRWVIGYDAFSSDGTARQKKLSIAKAYPGFAPVPGTKPAEGPLPIHKGMIALMALFTLTAAVGGWAMYRDDGGTHETQPPQENSLTEYQTYTRPEMEFLLDPNWTWQEEEGYFQDPAGETDYRIAVSTGSTEEMVLEALTDPVGQWRMDPNFEGFSFAHPGAEDSLTEIRTQDGNVYRYEVISLRFRDGTGYQRGVALTEGGIMVMVEAGYGEPKQAESVSRAIEGIFYQMHPIAQGEKV